MNLENGYLGWNKEYYINWKWYRLEFYKKYLLVEQVKLKKKSILYLLNKWDL